MLKKLYDWTPRDIAYWEKIRSRGRGNFMIRYGLVISSGVFFLVFGLATLFNWLRHASVNGITTANFIFLLGQLLFIGILCILAGLINALITWELEERLYRKYAGAIGQ